MTTHIVPVVGMHFRPPAKAILQVLPGGTELIAEREPDNPYDPNAIKVNVASKAIPQEQHETLGLMAAGYGFDVATIMATPVWQLGYIAKEHAAMLAPIMDQGGSPQSVMLSFTPEGKPQLTLLFGDDR